MWSGLVKLFREKKVNHRFVLTEKIIEEIEGIKKSFRKQTVLIELLRKEVRDRIEEREIKDLNPFFEFSEAFFYHDRSLRERGDISSSQMEALDIAWQKLDALLSSVGIEMIRKTDVDFDPRLHEAVEKIAEGNGAPSVKKIVQPGYLDNGNVFKPAKVIVEREHTSENSFK